MAILSIIAAPDSRLRVISERVSVVGPKERRLLDDMLETMYSAPGIGLSAVQVGIARRMVVIDTAKDPHPQNPVRMVNPEVIWKSDTEELREEGCLSFPDQFVEIKRPLEVEVKYIDEANKKQIRRAAGLEAIALQHELDHLDGILFVDKISSIKRNIILRKMKKLQRKKSSTSN